MAQWASVADLADLLTGETYTRMNHVLTVLDRRGPVSTAERSDAFCAETAELIRHMARILMQKEEDIRAMLGTDFKW